jgi:hypothetical protein
MRLQSSARHSQIMYHDRSHKPITVLTLGAASTRHAFMDPLLTAPDVSSPVEPAQSGIQFYRVDAPALLGEELDP